MTAGWPIYYSRRITSTSSSL